MKIKSIFVLLVLLAGLLTACSSEGANPSTNGSSDQGNAVVQDTGSEDNDQPADPTATQEQVVEQTAAVSFANDVFPILESRCLTCHGGDRTEGGLVMTSYASLMSGGKDGLVILPGDAAGSLLYELVSTGKMPKRGANLTPVQLETLLDWINSGALDN